MLTLKKISSILLLAILLSSCSDVVFKAPQPYKEATLSLFPPQLTGTYAFYDETGQATQDTISILYNRLFYEDLNGETLFYGELNKNIDITKDGSFFFLNIKQENKSGITLFYDVYVLERINSSRYSVFSFDMAGDEDMIARLKKITPTKFEAFNIDDEVRRVHLVNPTKSQLTKMIYENIAIKIGEIKRIK